MGNACTRTTRQIESNEGPGFPEQQPLVEVHVGRTEQWSPASSRPCACFGNCCRGQCEGRCFPKCCGVCCCCLVCAAIILYAVAMFILRFDVYATTFTYDNYASPMANYLQSGMADNYSLTQWYQDITVNDPLVGEGPGPNTRMFYGWHDVHANLRSWAPMIRNHTMIRYNELGVTIMNSEVWPEVGTIALGYSNADHALVRPYLGDALDNAQRPDADCDGATCWNAAWLRRVFRQRFASMQSLASSDFKWLVTIVLHKVHLNIDLSDEEARNFADFMTAFLLPQAIPPRLASTCLVHWLFDISGVLATKASLMSKYKTAIQAKWPHEAWDNQPRRLELLASAICDSLALAGGLSVPTALDHMLALLVRDDRPAGVRIADMRSMATRHNFMLEALRRFPPVAGIPRWVTSDGGATWNHQIPNVAQALQDGSVFPRPLDFILGRPGLNYEDHSLSMGWAEPARVDDDPSNPDSHACPAKQLSIQLISACLQELDAAGTWQVDNSRIEMNMYMTSGFTLTKVSSHQAIPSSHSAPAEDSHTVPDVLKPPIEEMQPQVWHTANVGDFV